MEFMATYGWSLIIGLIAVGAFFLYLNLDSSSVLSDSCIMGSGLKCVDYEVSETEVKLVVLNSMGKDLSEFFFSVEGCGDSSSEPLKNGQQSLFVATDCMGLNQGEVLDLSAHVHYSFTGSSIVHARDITVHANVNPSESFVSGECGNGVQETGETCDDFGATIGGCSPSYGGQCQYCDSFCDLQTVYGDYCGDGICQSPEESCSICFEDCDLPDGTCCGDNSVDGTEQCDDGINNGQVCSLSSGYNQSCTYCEISCFNQIVYGPYCGDFSCDNYPLLIQLNIPKVQDVFGIQHTVVLVTVGTTSARFSVDGIPSGVMAIGTSKNINGVELYVVALYEGAQSASILLGENSVVCPSEC